MKRAAMLLAIVGLLTLPLTALAAAEPFSANLTTGAEVPPVTGEGTGLASVTISDDGTSIDYEVSYQDLTGPVAAAHIHFGSETEAGGVIFPLEHGASPFAGTLTEADFTPLEGGPQTYEEALDAIRDGMTYVNLHTAAHEGGEIRGQLLAVPDTATTAPDQAPSALPWTLVLAAIGLAVLVPVARRFAIRIA